ncbi:LpqB family beta-propeller domain-containing protein [Fodinibius salinus]|nr:LpqB family beta-propeller domain-containing protein [Fodinibius salinus]
MPSSGRVTLAGLSEGDVDAKLSGIAGNCSVNGSNPQTVTITAGDTTSTSFAVSCQTVADGQIAFISDRDGDGEVFLMNTDGSSPTKLTDNSDTDFAGPISPTGTKIAFVSDRGGSTTHLYVMNADGSNVQQLTSSGASVNLLLAGISWSPDGSTLAFVDSRSGNGEVYTIGADGSGEQRLTNNSATDTWPHWSPDGSKILYASDTDGDYEIYTMNTDGTGRQQLTTDSDNNGMARWSPDGSKVAFASNRSGNLEIYTMNPDGTGVQQVTSDPGSDEFPSWSPDGSELAFYTDRAGNDEVYKINADGSGIPTNLTANNASDVNPYWSPVE